MRARPPRCSRSAAGGRWSTPRRRCPRRQPIQAAYARHPAAEARIRALAASGGFDVVHVEHLRGALLVPPPGPIPTVYDGVDCITRLFEQTLRLAPGLAQRAMARLDVARTRRFERQPVAAFRPDDRIVGGRSPRLPRPRPDGRSRLRHRAAQRRRPRRARPALPADDGRTVLFAGKLSYHANEAAARRLARRGDAAGRGHAVPRRGWCWPARTRLRRCQAWRLPVVSRSPAM